MARLAPDELFHIHIGEVGQHTGTSLWKRYASDQGTHATKVFFESVDGFSARACFIAPCHPVPAQEGASCLDGMSPSQLFQKKLSQSQKEEIERTLVGRVAAQKKKARTASENFHQARLSHKQKQRDDLAGCIIIHQLGEFSPVLAHVLSVMKKFTPNIVCMSLIPAFDVPTLNAPTAQCADAVKDVVRIHRSGVKSVLFSADTIASRVHGRHLDNTPGALLRRVCSTMGEAVRTITAPSRTHAPQPFSTLLAQFSEFPFLDPFLSASPHGTPATDVLNSLFSEYSALGNPAAANLHPEFPASIQSRADNHEDIVAAISFYPSATVFPGPKVTEGIVLSCQCVYPEMSVWMVRLLEAVVEVRDLNSDLTRRYLDLMKKYATMHGGSVAAYSKIEESILETVRQRQEIVAKDAEDTDAAEEEEEEEEEEEDGEGKAPAEGGDGEEVAQTDEGQTAVVQEEEPEPEKKGKGGKGGKGK